MKNDQGHGYGHLYIPPGPPVDWEELTRRRVLFSAHWLIDRTDQGPVATAQSILACCENVNSPDEVTRALTELVQEELLEQDSNGFTLTDQGQGAAEEIPSTNVFTLNLPGFDWDAPITE